MPDHLRIHRPHLSYHYNEGLIIEDMLYSRILAKYPAPVLVYSAGKLRDNLKSLKAAVKGVAGRIGSPSDFPPPKFKFAYCLKACYASEVLKTISKSGVHVEVMSQKEFRLARKAGWKPGQMIWNSPGKSAADLELIVKEGVGQVNVDCLSELEDLDRIAGRHKRKVKFGIRLHPNLKGRTSAFIDDRNRFGFDTRRGAALKLCEDLTRFRNLRLSGIHAHAFIRESNWRRFRPYVAFMFDFAAKLYAHTDIRLDYINLGGGIDSRYRSRKADILLQTFIHVIRLKYAGLPYQPTVFLELGRYITADTGFGLARIVRIKKGKEAKWVILDMASNILIPLNSADFGVIPAQYKRGRALRYHVGDNLSSYAGVITRDCVLKGVAEGDCVLIENCGAYTQSMASQFGHEIPPVLVADKGNLKVCR